MKHPIVNVGNSNAYRYFLFLVGNLGGMKKVDVELETLMHLESYKKNKSQRPSTTFISPMAYSPIYKKDTS